MTSNEKEAANATGPAADLVSAPNPNAGRRKPRVARTKSKSTKKATPTVRRVRGRKSAKRAPKATRIREGSKTAKLLDLLRRSGGATLKELMKASGWQAHSVRGFLSTMGKKRGLRVNSSRDAGSDRRYSVEG